MIGAGTMWKSKKITSSEGDAEFDLPPAACRKRWLVPEVLCGCVAIAIVVLAHLQHRTALTACLPGGMTLEHEINDGIWGNTVGTQLARVGAYAHQGKIYDHSGREVLVFTPPWDSRAIPFTPENVQYQERVIDGLRAKYTLILVVGGPKA